MKTSPTIEDVQNHVNHVDAAKRKEAEASLLNDARSLTNGKSGCPMTMGRVLLGITEITIENRETNRLLLEAMPTLQTKRACGLLHKKRGFNLSTNITIIVAICTVGGFIGKFAGWW